MDKAKLSRTCDAAASRNRVKSDGTMGQRLGRLEEGPEKCEAEDG